MEPSEHPDLRAPFGADVGAPAHVRERLAVRLDATDAAARDLMLAASELVTNVIVHTSGGGDC